MEISVFEFVDYKRFLRSILKGQERFRRGGRIRFAEAMECRPGYVTQVLNHDADFSFEQAEKLARFIALQPSETEHFLTLVAYARAGTKSLREHYRASLERAVSKRVNLKDQIKPSEILSEPEQALYYSSWHYSVIHILCTIPEYQSNDAIAKRIGLSNERVSSVLSDLERCGLIESKSGRFQVSSKQIFIDKDSAFNYRHHSNFRQLVAAKLDRLEKNDFHYSGVHSLSKKDSGVVIELIRSLIIKSRSVIKASPEEELYGFNIDFFKV